MGPCKARIEEAAQTGWRGGLPTDLREICQINPWGTQTIEF